MDTSAGVDGTCSWAALGGFMRNMVQESSLTGRALRIVEVASMLGVSVKTVRRMVPDNDAPGIAHAQHVAESLNGSGVIARVLPLPGLGEKEDVSDWIAAGGTAEQLMELALASLSSKPPANLTQDTQEFQDVQDTQDYQESINVGKGNDGAERVGLPHERWARRSD